MADNNGEAKQMVPSSQFIGRDGAVDLDAQAESKQMEPSSQFIGRDGAVDLDAQAESMKGSSDGAAMIVQNREQSGSRAAPNRVANGGRGRRRSSGEKIMQLLKGRNALKRKLDKMENADIETEDDYLYMDKARAKLLKIEKALRDADVFEDAPPIYPIGFSLPRITVAQSGLQPLNELLTTFVNDTSVKSCFDGLTGFRHVMPDDIDSMLEQLRANGHGDLIDRLLKSGGSKHEVCERIAENTNKWCKSIRLGGSDNRLINYEEWVGHAELQQIDTALASEALQNGTIGKNGAINAEALAESKKSFVEKLIRAQETGELTMGGEPSSSIDLNDRKAGEADEKRGSSEDDEEDAVVENEKKDDGVNQTTKEAAEQSAIMKDGGEQLPGNEATGGALPDANGEEREDGEGLNGDEDGDDELDDIDSNSDGEIDLLSDAGEEDGDERMEEVASDGQNEGEDGSVEQIAEAIQRLPNGTPPTAATANDCEIIELDSDSDDEGDVQPLN